MVIAQSLDRSDPWQARLATATTFELLAPSFTEHQLEPFFSFLIDHQALGDRISDVRRGMLSAGYLCYRPARREQAGRSHRNF